MPENKDYKYCKKRKMLSNRSAPYIQPLMKLIETQSKAMLVIWAVNYSELILFEECILYVIY